MPSRAPAIVRNDSEQGVVRVLSDGPCDEELVRRGLEGNGWATRLLYRRHLASAMQTALRTLRSRTEAEDVVQEAFLTAFSRLDQLREPGAFPGWLRRIVVTKVHRRLRKGSIETVDGFETEASPDASPAVRAELRLLDEVLDQIDPRDRVAWTLRYVLGYTLEEVGEASGCSLATAKRRIRAAHSVVTRHVRIGAPDE